jgi:hypothetical protein
MMKRFFRFSFSLAEVNSASSLGLLVFLEDRMEGLPVGLSISFNSRIQDSNRPSKSRNFYLKYHDFVRP